MKRFKTGRAFVFRYAVKLQFSVLFYPLSIPLPSQPYHYPCLLHSRRRLGIWVLYPSRSFSFETPFISYKQRAPENKTLKNFIVSRIFARLHLLRCRLSRHEAFTRLLPRAQKQQESLTKDA